MDVSSEQQKGKWYETERHPGDEYINAYNPTVLKFWKANMDIQLINCAEMFPLNNRKENGMRLNATLVMNILMHIIQQF